MKKTFSYISLHCHDQFNTKEREKNYDNYLSRINRIVCARRPALTTGLIRRGNSNSSVNVIKEYEKQLTNVFIYHRLMNINTRPARVFGRKASQSNTKQRRLQAAHIRSENQRLYQSISKVMVRPNRTFNVAPKIVRKGMFQVNRPRRLPLVMAGPDLP
jgi:hypothetical protein